MTFAAPFSSQETTESANQKIDESVAAVAPTACRREFTITVDVGNGIPDIVRQVPCSLAPHDGPEHGLASLSYVGPCPPAGYGGPKDQAKREAYLTAQREAAALEAAQQSVTLAEQRRLAQAFLDATK